MFNKPDMAALDSRTKSGKLIDSVIECLEYECIKTNFANSTNQPKGRKQLLETAFQWHRDNQINLIDRIVLLGNWVDTHFKSRGFVTISVSHPASVFGKQKREDWAAELVNDINVSFLTPLP